MRGEATRSRGRWGGGRQRVVSPVDREARHPLYRFLMHLGLPVSVSLTVHLGLLVLLGLKTFGVLSQPGTAYTEYEARVVDSPPAAAETPFQWSDLTPPPPPADLTPGPSMDELLNLPVMPDVDTQALGGGTGGGDLAGAGLGEGALAVLGTGGGAGTPGSGGLGAGLGEAGGQLGQAGIWNLSVRANKIVYVVDFSGSIIVAVDELKRELKRSVSRLKPAQLFDVIIFYSSGGGSEERVRTESFRPQLEPANERTRKEFFEWLDQKVPRGGTEPLEAMERALALRPDAVFLFSDGYFDDSVVGDITAANSQARARIYGVVFDDQLLGDTSGLAPRDTDGSRRLRRIAEANGGQVKMVTAKDLPRR